MTQHVPRTHPASIAHAQLAQAVQSAGATAEAPGLVRLALPTPTLPPATTTNHYFVGSRRCVLVDPATPERKSQDRLVALAAALQTAGFRLEALVLTHHHRDHVGAATELAARMGLPVRAHAITAELLAGEVRVDEWIADGDVVAEDAEGGVWRALHTPGHAPGHLVLQQAGSGGMVAGDMVAGEGTILIDPRDGRMSDYLASLDKMAKHGATFLAPAHGPGLTDGQAVLAHYRSHRLAREARVETALRQACVREPWVAADALLPTAYGDVSRLVWPLALRSMRSHLEHLRELGRAQTDGQRWQSLV